MTFEDEDVTRVLGDAMLEYAQWRAYRPYDDSVESFLREKEWQTKAALYDTHMEQCGRPPKQNPTVRIELIEGTDRTG